MLHRLVLCLFFSVQLTANQAAHFMGIGSSVIDFLAQVDDDFIASHIPGQKGGSVSCDPETFDRVFAVMGPNPKITLGGSAGNTVRTMAKLGVPSTFTSLVGEDLYGKRYCEEMHEMGISGIVRDPNFKTIRILCLITPEGERTFLHAYKAIGWSFKPNLDHFQNVKWVHFESYLLWEQPEFIEQSLFLAHESGAKVSLDLSNFLVVEQYREKLLEWVRKYVDIVFGNENEICSLTGLSPEEGCMRLQQSCPIVVVTKGGDGCLVGSQGTLTHIPGFSAKVVDTTAAGDYFIAGFIYGYLHQFPLPVCARIGHRLGSSIIEHIGAELPKEKWEEIHSFLQLENL
jgi:sugar/nucleoside kinase (ribokinase family)